MTGLNIPQNTTLVHSVNDIMLISLNETQTGKCTEGVDKTRALQSVDNRCRGGRS